MTARRIILLWLLATAAVCAIVLGACKSDPAPTVLQAVDLSTADSGFLTAPFDRNTIIDSASFTDSQSIDRDAIQKFFAKTPYSRPSFLETYQSNGIRASDAVANAATQYRINPLVFITMLEVTQGLMGARDYVFPPERVEYVFNCGCTQKTSCEPALAGLDRQLDCLGRTLRESLDAIGAGGTTASGWGTNKPMFTLDNQAVTPANDATAALYAWNPRLAIGQPGGQWVFWNVWNLYANDLEYIGPLGTSGGKWIGDACNANDECATVDGAVCASNYPNGMCVVGCSASEACPSDPSRAASFCAKFDDGNFCVTTCNPQAASCRDGMQCIHVDGAQGDKGYICDPGTTKQTSP